MQIEIKNSLNLNKILERAIFIHRLVYETKWFKQRHELASSETDNIKSVWNELKENNEIISISGFFQIDNVGYVPLTIYKSGLIIAPEELTEKDLEIIQNFLKT